MAQVTPKQLPGITLFNSSLETGVRALIVLNAVHPKILDLPHLTWFDHLVVHTGDIGGPESLHPNVPQRSGELLIRRRIIEQSLMLMRRLHFVDVVANEQGIFYQASDESSSFVGLLRSAYARTLKDRARWLAKNICTRDSAAIEKLVADRIGRWKVEFQGESQPTVTSL